MSKNSSSKVNVKITPNAVADALSKPSLNALEDLSRLQHGKKPKKDTKDKKNKQNLEQAASISFELQLSAKARERFELLRNGKCNFVIMVCSYEHKKILRM